jgi:hypothetical protein
MMAKVYYVKDGSYPQNLVDPFGRRIALAELERRLHGQDLRYLSTLPPEFNREQPSHEVKYVIVELAMDELSGQRLTRTGYFSCPSCLRMRRRPSSFRRCKDKHHADDLDCAENSVPHATGATLIVPGHDA